MPPPTSTAELLTLVKKSQLLRPEMVAELEADHLPFDPNHAAGVLVTRRILTQFQAKLLLVGRYKGFRLGPYILTDLLGRGGMGTVYKAIHEALRRPVALKVLTDHRNQLTRERFQREARAAAALDHPNIVRTHDIGRDGDAHYIVMEYVEGQTLNHLIETNGAMSVADATDAIIQAAAGLQHAHERGFLHRDIKPANLIRMADGTIKILDMGLARSADNSDDLTVHLDKGAIVGTADYISPEQAMNDSRIDIRSDIYSLGATYYVLLTGRTLFEGSTVSKLAQHQLKSPKLSDMDSHVPLALRTVLGKMIAKKPADRYRTPAEVIAALKPWQSKNVATNPAPTPRRRSAWPIWIATGVILLSVGVALALAYSSPSR